LQKYGSQAISAIYEHVAKPALTGLAANYLSKKVEGADEGYNVKDQGNYAFEPYKQSYQGGIN